MAASGWDFFRLRVLRAVPLGASAVRITLTGPQLDGFRSGGRDQRFKLFLPQPGEAEPLVPTWAGSEWFTAWRELDPAQRGIMRSYTVSAQQPGTLDVDFAVHGGTGPAARWAASARPGDRVLALGPTDPDNAGVDFRPPPRTDAVLLAGDLTALPAIAAILETLDPALPVRAFVEVPDRADHRALPCGSADAQVHWTAPGELPEALADCPLPGDAPYAWIAGEAGSVRALRRHLVRDRGLPRAAVTFTGYWRLGATEEQLVAEAVAIPPQTSRH
ncbi:siderophore-interacting protein [Streptacidiphilus fuscans]|uniref:Siderophore-interacting protein n=1 Tax=Streptacidiphilus fuscans TaxID=2789292 RepID=A0A931B3J0_9ACTN|nr:siderophore-interacting protein [Streptacidiphilus fuscans]MBF9069643.1 siderophore-interacting protein [Streptacidiphilus fuscans]